MSSLFFTYLNHHDIEALAMSPQEILDAVEEGLRAQGAGETVIEPVAGSAPDTSAIQAWLGEQMASFKVPRAIEVIDQLPREAHGKLKKRLLRDPYWEDQPG